MVNKEKQRRRAMMKQEDYDDEETWEEVVEAARFQEELLGLEPGSLGPTYFIQGEGEVSQKRYLEWCRETGRLT